MHGAASQTSAPWNLQSMSTRQPVGGTDPKQMIYTYTYNEPIGDGIDIYILDSGVYIEHNEFEGRASWGWVAPGLTQRDVAGHGTYIAGIAAGKTYGVAKKANIIAVKILDDNNGGVNARSVEGLNWVAANVRSTGRHSIACLAFGGAYSQAVNNAASIMFFDGITAITAAGNSAQDASGWSPASASSVIVVGASDITNKMWPSSNYGDILDLFAPAVTIPGPATSGPSSGLWSSGTSGACAVVAGIAATLLSQDPSLTPGALTDKILSLATQNVVTGVPAGTTTNLVYNGVSP
jgi:cerevisin